MATHVMLTHPYTCTLVYTYTYSSKMMRNFVDDSIKAYLFLCMKCFQCYLCDHYSSDHYSLLDHVIISIIHNTTILVALKYLFLLLHFENFKKLVNLLCRYCTLIFSIHGM